jgi:hypothetical protein
MTRVEICICPTEMDLNGDRYDEAKLLLAIRYFVLGRLGVRGSEVDIRIGYSQGVAWERVDGNAEAGHGLMSEFWENASDPALFAEGGDEE